MRHDKGRLPPFVPLLRDTMRTPAWLALTHGARSLYVALKGRYSNNLRNNGRLFLSTRDAAEELGSNRDSVQRWYRELEHYGFIVQTSGGSLGVDGKGKAPHWRLTELGYMRDPATRDFAHWSGIKFSEPKKQNPGPNSGSRVAPIVGPVVDAIVGPVNGTSGRDSGAIYAERGGPNSGSITSIYHCASASALSLPLSPSSPDAIAAQRRRLDDLSARLSLFAPVRVLPKEELNRKIAR
jgi:hypothetical protein